MIDEVGVLLPTLHQKLAVLVLTLIGVFWIVRQVRYQRIREEHALLWLLGLAALLAVIWIDPLLYAVTAVLGIHMPASALLLLALFFLFIIAVWLTSIVSLQKQQIAELFISLSMLQAKLEEREASEADNEDA